jgi:biopolymer transport protein ExbD
MLLPESKADEVQVSQKNILHIIVRPDGRIVLKKGKNPEEAPIPINGLAERMRQEITLNPKIIAAVKTDPDAPYEMMTQVLDELQEAEANRISLQMLEEK